MSYPITPDPSIHNLPPAALAQQRAMTQQQVQAMGQRMVDGIVNAVLGIITKGAFGPLAGTVSSDAKQLLADVFDGLNYTSNTALGTAKLVEGQVDGVLVLVQTITAAVQNFIDTIVQFFSPILGINNVISEVATVMGASIGGLLAAAVDGLDGTATALSNIVLHGDGTAALNLVNNGVYSLIDHADGTVMSVAGTLSNIANTFGTSAYSLGNWTTLMGQAGLASASHLASSLNGVLPTAVDNLDGTAQATLAGAKQIAQNLDGTASYVASTASSAVTTLLDNVDGTAMSMAHAVQNAVMGAQQAGVNLVNTAGSIWGTLFGAFNGAATPAAATPTQAYTALANNAATVSTNSQNIGGLAGLSVSNLNQALQRSGTVGAGGSSGTYTTVNFSSYSDQATLAGIFTQSGSGMSGVLGASEVSQIGVTSGAAIWQSAATTGYDWNYHATPTTTDYQIVSATLAALNDQTSHTYEYLYLIGRSNTAMTTCVIIYLTGTSAVMAAITGGSYTLLAIGSHTPVVGGLYELVLGDRATSNLYKLQLLCNGTPILSVTDSGHSSQYGPSLRYAGLGMQNTNSGTRPASFAAWGLADNAPASTIGSGFRAYRASSSTASSGSNTVLPASFMDTQQYCTSDLTWDATTNKVTVSIAGWYMVSFGLYNGTNFAGSVCGPALYQNGVMVNAGLLNNPSASHSEVSILSCIRYCAAGDYLQPGTTGAAQTILGDSSGAYSYFEVALMNCGTLS